MLAAGAVGITVMLLPTPEGLPPSGHRYLAILSSLLVMFLTEPVPLPLVMASAGCSLVVSNVGSSDQVWSAYAHPVVFFVLGCLMLANIAENVGLTRRLGNIMLRHCGTRVVTFSLWSCLLLGMASSLMHDVTALTMGIMAILPLMRQTDIAPGTPTGIFLILSMAFCSSAGGMATLVGGGRNMVAAAFLKDLAGMEIGFFEWTLYAMPPALVSIPAVWLALFLVFRPDTSLHFPEDAVDDMGELSRDELTALAVIGGVFLCFFTRTIHGIDYSIIVVGAVVVLTLLGLIEWNRLNERTEWAVSFLVFGGGISLGQAMEYTGTAEFLAGLFFPFFEGRGWFLLFLGVGVFASLLTQLMANVASAALILPVAIPMAIMSGVNPVLMALSLGIFTSFAYLLVVACPPNVVAYSVGYFRASDLLRGGLVAQPVGMLCAAIVAYGWWSLLGLVG